MLGTVPLCVSALLCSLYAPPDVGSGDGVDPAPALEATDGDALDPAPVETAVRPVLRVVASGAEPFVVKDGEDRGISLEVCKEVADRAGYEHRLEYVDGIAPGVERVASGDADVLVGPVSITADRA